MEIIDKINAMKNTFIKAGVPLSDDQEAVLAGCLAVWLNQRASDQWVSVKDRLPENIGYFLTALKNNNPNWHDEITNTVSLWHGDHWGNILAGDVTHWMPLPQPPADDKE